MSDAGNGTPPQTRPEPTQGATVGAGNVVPPEWPSWPGVARPAGWFLRQDSVQESWETEDDGAEPAYDEEPAYDNEEPGQNVQGQWYVAGEEEPADYWYEEDPDAGPDETTEPREADAPVVGPTAALSGRPGGPGFRVPPGAVPGLSDQRSPWEQAQEVWQDSGVSWERPAEEYEEPWVPQTQDPGSYRVPPGFGGTAQDPGWRGPLSAPTMADAPMMTEPPTVADAPGRPPLATRTGARPGAVNPPRPGAVNPPRPSAANPMRADPQAYQRAWPRDYGDGPERDQVVDPWQSQRMRYPDLPPARVRRGPRRRRPTPMTVARVGVPVVVIVGVGAVAVMMLTGRTNMMLAERGNDSTPPRQTSHAPSTAPTARTAPASTAPTASTNGMNMTAFPGYAGRPARAEELVEGLAANGAVQVAVGTDDGLPAIWAREGNGEGNGAWSLVTAPETKRQGIQQLVAVAQGAGGWIAVGDPAAGATPHPVILTSPDGRTWQVVDGEHAFSYPGSYAYGAAAGPAGYIVVGKIHHDGRTYAATWWSTNLRDWIRGGNGGLDGRLASSQMLAAAATPGGFVAVGQHAGRPATWMSGTAHDWMEMDLPMPAGASSATLTKVVASGDRLVALGEAATGNGVMPFAAVSTDGGASWQSAALTTPGGSPATVTALTATPAGFVAAGRSGQSAFYWISADGSVWSAPKSAGSGITSITGLAPAAANAGGTTVTGVGTMDGHPAIVTVPAG